MSYNSCLLINQNQIFKNKAQTIQIDNILQSGKKDILAQQIKDKFKPYLFGTNNNKSINDIMQQIEVRVENGFKKEQDNSARRVISSPISLEFNGKALTIVINENNTIQRISFQAVSGEPQKINGKYYFIYEKEKQMLKNKGPIPEGEYYITPLSENIDDGVQEWDKISIWQQFKSTLGGGQWAKATPAWGKIRIPIQPKTITLKDSKGNVITRNNFFIHGGAEAGSSGCIDLWDKNKIFFEKLLSYVEKYKNEILKNQGKIPLLVKYEDSIKVECDGLIYKNYCKPVKWEME